MDLYRPASAKLFSQSMPVSLVRVSDVFFLNEFHLWWRESSLDQKEFKGKEMNKKVKPSRKKKIDFSN